MTGYVYIMTNKPNGTLYIGVTNNLSRRVWEHKENKVEGFTQKYGLKTLVFFEEFETMPLAISEEKRIKAWKRSWKVRLILEMNSEWEDLYETLNM